MGREPYFPPTPKADAYRTAAAQAPIAEPVPPKRVVASRPEPERGPERAARDVPAPRGDIILAVTREERSYWARHRLYARYPRAIGAVVLVLGVLLTWNTVDVLIHGGVYSTRGVPLGPIAVTAGLWSVWCGYPLRPDGRPTAAWKTGMVIAIIVGLLAGFGLRAAFDG